MPCAAMVSLKQKGFGVQGLKHIYFFHHRDNVAKSNTKQKSALLDALICDRRKTVISAS